MNLTSATSLLRLLGDPTRLRLLNLLEQEELTVAEITGITQLAQSRVSTHLAKLKEAQLVRDRKVGVHSYYSIDGSDTASQAQDLFKLLQPERTDPLFTQDIASLSKVIASRGNTSWADTVAGEMQRHYSPGRTLEATAKAVFPLLQLGHVLDLASGDGAIAELIAEQAQSVSCVDISPKVIAAGKRRLQKHHNVSFHLGDMHALTFPADHFDHILMLNALSYSAAPQQVFKHCFKVMKPGAILVTATLKKHQHEAAVTPYDHVNLGFTESELKNFASQAGLHIRSCSVTLKEQRPPHFEIMTLVASKPEKKPTL